MAYIKLNHFGFWDLLKSLWITEKYMFKSIINKDYKNNKLFLLLEELSPEGQLNEKLKNRKEKLDDEFRKTLKHTLLNSKVCPACAIKGAVYGKDYHKIKIDKKKCVNCNLCNSFFGDLKIVKIYE